MARVNSSLLALVALICVAGPAFSLRMPAEFLGSLAGSAVEGSSGVTPEAARVQIQAVLANFSSALADNDTALAAQALAPSVTVLAPGRPLRVLASPAAQEKFVVRLAQCGLRLQLTVADLVLGPSVGVPPAEGEVTSRDSGVLSAISRVNFVAFTRAGALADVGKAIILWNATLVPTPADVNDDKKAEYTWQVVSALWSSDVEGEQRLGEAQAQESGDEEGEWEEEAELVGDDAPTAAELATTAQSVLASFNAAVRQGDIVGAAKFVAPCADILAPGHPRTVLASTLDLTHDIQRLIAAGMTFNTEVLNVSAISVKADDSNSFCGAAARDAIGAPVRGSSGDVWILASGRLNETDMATGEVLRAGKFSYIFRPAPKEDLEEGAMGDRPLHYVIQTAAWNFDAPKGPAPNTSEALEAEAGPRTVGDISPVDAMEQLRATLSDFTQAVWENDTVAAAGKLARTVFVLAPGSPPAHLVSAADKEAYLAHVHKGGLRLQHTFVDVAVGKPKAFAPVPSANSDDLVALAYVNYVAFTPHGTVGDVGKMLLLWIKDGFVGAPVGDAPPVWKLYWISFNSDTKQHPARAAYAPPSRLVSAGAAAAGDVKPAVVVEQLSVAVEQLSLALAANNTFVAAKVFAPSTLLLPEERPARTLTTQEEKEEVLQVLVEQGLSLTEEFDEVVLAGLSFFSDSSRDVAGASNGDVVYAITRGTYTIASNGSSPNDTKVVEEGHAVQVWTSLGSKAGPLDGPTSPAPEYAVRWAQVSHIPILSPSDDDPDAAPESQDTTTPAMLFAGASTVRQGPLESPKPDTTKLDLDLALKNLSLAACAGKEEYLLSLIGDNVTVIAPGSAPLFLNETDDISAFFNSSFLPCGVKFIIADIAVGSGALAPEPAPVPPTPAHSAASNNDDSYLAVTHIVYIDYASLSIGKALALWTLGAKKKEPQSAAVNGQDRYFWNLTVIAWSSDLPATESLRARVAAASVASEESEEEVLGHRLKSALLQAVSGGSRREVMESGASRSAAAVADAATLGDTPVAVWPALTDALSYFAANISAGDVVNASLIFTSIHPYLFLKDGTPPVEVVTQAEREAFVKEFSGMDFDFDIQTVWQLLVKESSVGLADRGQGNAFAIVAINTSVNGTLVETGHSLVLWDSVPVALPSDSSTLGDSKVYQFALRWEHFTSMPLPAPAPAPAPAPVPEPEPEPAAPAPEEPTVLPPPPPKHAPGPKP